MNDKTIRDLPKMVNNLSKNMETLTQLVQQIVDNCEIIIKITDTFDSKQFNRGNKKRKCHQMNGIESKKLKLTTKSEIKSVDSNLTRVSTSINQVEDSFSFMSEKFSSILNERQINESVRSKSINAVEKCYTCDKLSRTRNQCKYCSRDLKFVNNYNRIKTSTPIPGKKVCKRKRERNTIIISESSSGSMSSSQRESPSSPKLLDIENNMVLDEESDDSTISASTYSSNDDSIE